ncbi:DinB family protein [candidate division KSB1 bacterium]|nr:MAG: DinB family protein [candidate division KSB1 bacterium]
MAAINLIRQFQFNQMTLTRLLADVTSDESLREIETAGKSVNWIAGHIIVARGKLLSALGAEPSWYPALMAMYGGQEAGKYSADKAKSVSELQTLIEETLNSLTDTLTAVETKLADPCDVLPHVKSGGTVADRVGAFACHEAYHVGQIGLMRRLLGKPGLF